MAADRADVGDGRMFVFGGRGRPGRGRRSARVRAKGVACGVLSMAVLLCATAAVVCYGLLRAVCGAGRRFEKDTIHPLLGVLLAIGLGCEYVYLILAAVT